MTMPVTHLRQPGLQGSTSAAPGDVFALAEDATGVKPSLKLVFHTC